MDIIVVNEKDEILEMKEIGTFDWQREIYRVSGLWFFNDRGEVLSAQRAFSKEQSPGTWGPSVAGIVEPHETYLSNILKETEEEVGIHLTAKDLIEGPKELVHNTNPDRQYFLQWFFAYQNIPGEELVLQEDEVAAVKWVHPEELLAALAKDPQTYSDISPDVLEAIPKQYS